MKQTKIKNQNAITLLSLVVLIIILLILSGIVLNLVLGEQGITQRAINATKAYDISGAKEQAEMLAATYVNNYYEEKHISGNEVPEKIGDYVLEKLKTESSVGDYEISIIEGRIIVRKNENFDSGKIKDNGEIVWDKYPFDPNTIELGDGSDAKDASYYGWKVTNYKSKYEEDNDITLIWRLFYKDSNYAYIILDTFDAELDGTVKTYMPSDYCGGEKYANGSKVSIVGQKLNSLISSMFVESSTNVNIKATAWLTDTEYWEKYTDKNKKAFFAIASPTAELFRNSFNATASTNGASTITLEKGTHGYTENTSDYQLNSSYNKGIYGKSDWWLASPGCSRNHAGLAVIGSRGFIRDEGVNNHSFVVRPIVCLPASEVPISVLINE